MAGHHHPGKFVAPKVRGRGLATVWSAAAWFITVNHRFFIEYRIYQDGGHHFLHHHSWEEPAAIQYLEKLDAKYPGSKLSTANMHH